MREARRGPDTLVTVARTLRVDQVTGEVFAAFASAGIRPLLLKGPSIAAWLYPDEFRPYADTDLLVAPAEWPRAAAVLAEMGFFDPMAGGADVEKCEYALHFYRDGSDGSRDLVDLHFTLAGVGAAPDVAWRRLSVDPDSVLVAGAEVPALSIAARVFHIALHASFHGLAAPKPLEDLRRALAIADPSVWSEAVDMAVDLETLPAFAAGLELLPAGQEILRAHGITEASSPSARLRATSPPVGTLDIERLAKSRGFGAKVKVAVREAAPTPALMRYYYPLARRGRAGLALAYLARPFRIARAAIPAYRAWRRAYRGPRPGPENRQPPGTSSR